MSASFSDLPLDVIDRLLMVLTDFQSLSSLLQTCKLVYGTFQNHPKSIIRAVAENIIGPALPEAALLLAEHDDSFSLETLLSNPSRSEVTLLCSNASPVATLEELFCAMCVFSNA